MDLVRYFDDYRPPAGIQLQDLEDELYDELLADLMGESDEPDYSSYLKKDERILSLLREKKVRPANAVSLEREFIESLSFERFSKYGGNGKRLEAFSKACYKKVVAPMLKSVADTLRKNGGAWMDTMDLSAFYRYFPQGHFILEKPGYLGARLMSSCLGTYDWVPSARIHFHAGEEERSAELALDDVMNKKKRWSQRYLTTVCMSPLTVIDGTCLAEQALASVAAYLFREYLDGRALNEVRDDLVVGELLEHIREALRARRILTDDCLVMAREVCEEFGYDIADYIGNILECEVLVRPCQKEPALRKNELSYLYLFLDDLDTGLGSYGLRCKLDIAVPFLFSLMRDIDRKKKQEIYRRALRETAATVFMTKRNIPEKYLKAMTASRLNEVYGFVEIDEDCDLDRIREIEKEFLGFKQEYFHDLLFKSDAIRFRKLGRHHAAGLYFPEIHCQCVDVRYPDSFIHEYLHMYDYCTDPSGGQRSDKFMFRKVFDRYEWCLRNWMENAGEKDPQVSVLSGKTKYNLDYYLTPTEVFARCGEMYFRRILGVNSSLLGLCTGFAYPADDKLMELIREYYEPLFRPVEKAEAAYEETVR